MPTSIYDHWTQHQKASLGPLLELNNVTTRLYGELMRENLRAASEFAQSSQEQFKALSQAKDLKEIVQVQGQWISDIAPHAIKQTEKLLDMVLHFASEYRECYESNLESMRQQGKAMSDKMVAKPSKKED